MTADKAHKPPISVREEATRRLAATFVDRGETEYLHVAFEKADTIISWIADLLADDTCPRCHGKKTLGSEGSKCFVCASNGFVRKSDMVTVTSTGGMGDES